MPVHAEPTVLLLPGWLNSGEGHWQTRWEARYGDQRVEQADWQRPLRGDWMARLEEVILSQRVPGQPGASGAPVPDAPQAPSNHPPILLAAHSLGCHLVAAWAAHSQHTQRVAGALLVAPPDPFMPELPADLHNWRRPVLDRLPFPSTLVYSTDDPYCAPDAALGLAAAWGSAPVNIGARGHVNADSGLGDWAEGRAMLLDLLDRQI